MVWLYFHFRSLWTVFSFRPCDASGSDIHMDIRMLTMFFILSPFFVRSPLLCFKIFFSLCYYHYFEQRAFGYHILALHKFVFFSAYFWMRFVYAIAYVLYIIGRWRSFCLLPMNHAVMWFLFSLFVLTWCWSIIWRVKMHLHDTR